VWTRVISETDGAGCSALRWLQTRFDADLNCRDARGNTPLILAVRAQKAESARLLLQVSRPACCATSACRKPSCAAELAMRARWAAGSCLLCCPELP
jgi:ankyrin repeat protein